MKLLMIINLAGLIMEVKLRWKYTYDLCKNYLYDGDEKPVFTVFATNEQLEAESIKSPGFSFEVLESTCVYRNICEEILKYSCAILPSAVVHIRPDRRSIRLPRLGVQAASRLQMPHTNRRSSREAVPYGSKTEALSPQSRIAP